VQLSWSVFPLHPDTPPEGKALVDLFAGREEMVRDMQSRLRQIADAEGVPLAERTHTSNSRLAQELGKWAESVGRGDDFRRAVYRAYFVQGVNIALPRGLVEIAASVGLPADEASDVLKTRRFAPAVDADWRRAAELGITAVPTHLCGERRLTGFTPFDAFVRLIGKGE
jgi:predicted DsbA family dithiol-disulfide isomerase